MDFGPLKFAPVYQPKIWGGRNLERVFHRFLPPGKIGESWEISMHRSGRSVVVEPAELAGWTLEQLCQKYPQEIIGGEQRDFPLMVKLIDAQDVLSVQVHPDDDYAVRNNTTEPGKTEMWYVLAADPGAKLIYGLKPGTTRERLERAIASGTVSECLNEITVKPGDCFFIPAGAVHALGAGILVLEIQQTSDAVYRIFDWNRTDDQGRPRPLHVRQALEVIDFTFDPAQTAQRPGGSPDAEVLAACPFFTVTKHRLRAGISFTVDHPGFKIITSLNQRLRIESNAYTVQLDAGSSCLIPAGCSHWQAYAADGDAEIICSIR